MSWKNIKLIFLREVRDQLRDRRTLFMIAVLPLILYPAMGIGMVQMTVLFSEQPRTVVILGAEHLPQEPPLLQGDRFVSNWFEIPADAEKLEVLTDAQPVPEKIDEDEAERRAAILEWAKNIRRLVEEFEPLSAAETKARDAGQIAEADRYALQGRAVKERIGELFSQSNIQVLIVLPDDFAERISRINRELAERKTVPESDEPARRPIIIQNSADEKSMIAYRRVKGAIESWERQILEQRLRFAELPSSLPTPVNAEPIDVAKQEQIAANLWSKLFPALVVIMAVTGAFYPAVDLGAGEKERGTMETLLICPARRSEIVVGKFLTVMLFSLATALLNLSSMGFTGRYMVSVAGNDGLSKVGDFSLPGPLALTWVFVLLVPLAALFSALCLALATFARSSKEGQYYLTPLLMVTMGLTVFCLSPAVEIEPFYSVMPIVGPALLLKELLASPGSTEPLVYAVPVLVTSVGYSLLALWWAIDQFAREEVLFREAERFDFRLWVRHLLRDKEQTPSFAEAGLCFVMIMLLQFAGLRFFRGALTGTSGELLDLRNAQPMMLKLLLIQQLVVVASPALFMGVILTTSVARTFRLRLPSGRMLLAACLLPVALHPLTLELSAHLQWFFPPLPKGIQAVASAMSNADLPFWFVLLAFAVAPACCEELAFRGFMLSGFSRSGRVGVAIGLSSVAFGLMHMIPQQVFNAALLGVVLGLLAVRSNSLLPCVLFHMVYNGLEVVRARFGSAVPRGTPADWFLWFEEGAPRYRWTTLLIAAVVAALLLRMILQRRHAAVENLPEPDGGDSQPRPRTPLVESSSVSVR